MCKPVGGAVWTDKVEKYVNTDFNNVEFSVRFKKKMNLVFRKQGGVKNRVPNPEVDNVHERIRSGVVCFVSKILLCVKGRYGKVKMRILVYRAILCHGFVKRRIPTDKSEILRDGVP